MKKFLLAQLVIVLCSCASTSPNLSNWSIDYGEYLEDGFYISPLTEIKGERYTPISTIGTVYEYVYPRDAKTYSELLPSIIDNAIKKGANGIIGLKTNSYSGANGYRYAELEGVAIRIEGRTMVQNIGSVATQSVTAEKKRAYNFQKANASGMTLRIKEQGVSHYYDPETKEYITEEEFLKIYPEIDLLTIRKIKN